jgi:hypothetical protein
MPPGWHVQTVACNKGGVVTSAFKKLQIEEHSGTEGQMEMDGGDDLKLSQASSSRAKSTSTYDVALRRAFHNLRRWFTSRPLNNRWKVPHSIGNCEHCKTELEPYRAVESHKPKTRWGTDSVFITLHLKYVNYVLLKQVQDWNHTGISSHLLLITCVDHSTGPLLQTYRSCSGFGDGLGRRIRQGFFSSH